MSSALDRAKKLEAEAKALRRQEKEFWSDINIRRNEIIDYLNVGQFERICSLYGAYTNNEKEQLYSYLISEEQINTYKGNQQTEDIYSSVSTEL